MLALFQAFVIKYIPLDDKLLQHRSCPYTKLSCLIAVHTVTYGNNGIKVIEQRSTFHITLTLKLNLLNFSTSCLFCKFSTFINLRKVISNRCSVYAKQICHAFLRHPKCLVVEYHFNTGFTLCCFIQQYVGFQWVLDKFCGRNGLRKIFSCLLHQRFLSVCIFSYNHARHTRQTEYVHLSICTTTELDHINRLVEMVINLHAFLIGYGNCLIYDILEFPVSRISHSITKVARTPIFLVVFVSSADSIKRRTHFWYIIFLSHIKRSSKIVPTWYKKIIPPIPTLSDSLQSPCQGRLVWLPAPWFLSWQRGCR